MTSDISLLVIKPECLNILKRIILELKNRGYVIKKIYKRNDFSNDVKTLYQKDFSEDILEQFSNAYRQGDFGNNYIILIVEHTLGNTINRLIKDVGTSRACLGEYDGSMRSMFGLNKKYARENSTFEVVFNGLHKIDSFEELNYQVNALKLDDWESIMKL